MFDSLVPGSWTELGVGVGSVLIAAVLGGLAVKQAKEATRWAKKSTEWAEEAVKLQRWANVLAEAELPVRFDARMGHEVYHDGDEPSHPFDAWIEIEGGEGSASVFIRKVETAGAFFGSVNSKAFRFGELFGKQQAQPLTDELPKRLLAGEEICFRNPWSSYSPTLASNAWARVRVHFSVTEDSPTRDVEVDVCLDGVRPKTQPEDSAD